MNESVSRIGLGIPLRIRTPRSHSASDSLYTPFRYRPLFPDRTTGALGEREKE
ncbi:hypothetical protein AVEN_200221-1, partial [Araneus ventricosus]